MIINSPRAHSFNSSSPGAGTEDADSEIIVLALVFLLLIYIIVWPVVVIIKQATGFSPMRTLNRVLPNVDRSVLRTFCPWRARAARQIEMRPQISSPPLEQSQAAQVPALSTDADRPHSPVPQISGEDDRSPRSSLSESLSRSAPHSPNLSQHSLAVSEASTLTIAASTVSDGPTLVRQPFSPLLRRQGFS
ncbi:hypothetical protein MVEN_02447200 [Mycena venus]|uniref:Uncharacterized protein n=1 Tax=Mycena venus TaxID=2733690 RepID=A0A8H6WYZ4_9AGAR|nr:hypothetical protein MVEN_02447200 [Mycena venus]